MSQSIDNINPKTTISKIHTACKECVFSIYTENTQVGCSMNLLDKYKSKNTEIIEAYDEDKEFYILNNRKCIGFRKDSWFKQFNDSLDIEDKKIKVIDTFQLKYIVVIDLKLFTIESIEQLFIDLSNLDIKPSKIILIRYNYTNKIFDYEYIKNILEKSGLSCAWRLQTMLDEKVGIKSILSTTVSTNQQYKYILYINNYTNKINNIINKANNIIFDELGSFTVITDETYVSYLFLGILYRYAWYTNQIDILETKTCFTVV